MIAVHTIRRDNVKITKESIVYYWWFKQSCFKQLLKLLGNEVDYSKITVRVIDHEPYGLLYVGKGKNGNDRLIDYHIHDKQNFHLTGVDNGRLSSLRQTLCGLLQVPMSSGKTIINDFIDRNCVVDYEVVDTLQLDSAELAKISNNYLPLNYKNTIGVLSFRHRQILRQCKRRVKG